MASPSKSSLDTPSTTSIEFYCHESFEVFKLKAQALCQSIGFQDPVIERMEGVPLNRVPVNQITFNQVATITLASGDWCVLCILWRQKMSQKTAQNLRDQVAINSFVARHFPVPQILAYNTTPDNAIELPFYIQKISRGQCLREVLNGNLATNDRLKIVSIIANMLVRIEKVSFPTPGRLVAALDVPDRWNDCSTLSASVNIAPFMIGEREVRKSLSCSSVADFIQAILDQHYKISSEIGNPQYFRWKRLCKMNKEMKAAGLLTCQQLVLSHSDFTPQNIFVDRTRDNNWEVTAVLDWGRALCMPRVLTRKLPVWLWQLADQLGQGGSGNDLQVPRKEISQADDIKQHFEDCLEVARTDLNEYRMDAYDRAPWVTRFFNFAENELWDMNEEEKCNEFKKEWEAYYFNK